VNFPADDGKTFACTFTNTAEGTISVAKQVSGADSTDTFTFELREPSNDNDPENPADDTVGALLDTPGTAVAAWLSDRRRDEQAKIVSVAAGSKSLPHPDPVPSPVGPSRGSQGVAYFRGVRD
jgi:hypothetical protein